MHLSEEWLISTFLHLFPAFYFNMFGIYVGYTGKEFLPVNIYIVVSVLGMTRNDTFYDDTTVDSCLWSLESGGRFLHL